MLSFLEFDFNSLYIIIDAYIYYTNIKQIHLIYTYCFTIEVIDLHTLWLWSDANSNHASTEAMPSYITTYMAIA